MSIIQIGVGFFFFLRFSSRTLGVGGQAHSNRTTEIESDSQISGERASEIIERATVCLCERESERGV